MNHFSVGDKIVRTGSSNGRVKHGQTYVVTELVGDGYLRLEGIGFGTWDSRKFTLAATEKVKPVEKKAKGTKRDYVADHARRTLRTVGFSKEVAKDLVDEIIAKNEQIKANKVGEFSSALQRAALLNRDGTFNLSAISRKLPVGKGVLVQSFNWDTTVRGFEFWNKVYADVMN